MASKIISWGKKHPIIAGIIILIILSNVLALFIPEEQGTADNDPKLKLGEQNSYGGTSVNSTPPTTKTNEPIIIQNDDEIYEVTNIVDGDTIDIDTGERVRLICIDTPERGENLYQEASDYLEDLILGEDVELVKDVSETDRYGRILRYIYFDGDFINEEMVRKGYAKAYPYSPYTSLCPEIEDAEDYAKSKKLGIWADTQTDTTTDTSGDTSNAICECSTNKYNCSDFSTHSEAQACHDYCISQGKGDIHKIDGNDNDGLACESLP